MRYMKPVAAALALAIGASTLVGPAEAGRRHHHGHHGHHGDAAGLAVAGIFGLAAGAILGSAIAQAQPGYYAYQPAYAPPPPPVVYQQPSPVYYTRTAAPWTEAWYDYCGQFPSFDPQTGYVYGNDGTYQFCR